MDINEWLKKFETSWKKKDIPAVLSLFSKNVVYFETPFRKLKDFKELANEWQGVKNQKDISLEFETFSSCQNRHSVIWKLKYKTSEGIEKNVAGTYLIELNEEGLCTYFQQTCETL